MNSKTKGSMAERELLHVFWDAGWGAVRISGSGCTTLPAPDLLVGNRQRWLAIECKCVKEDYKYFSKEDIDQIEMFAMRFGAEPIIAIKYYRRGWKFYKTSSLRNTEKGYCTKLGETVEENIMEVLKCKKKAN